MRTLSLAISLFFAAALVIGCGDDTTPTPPKKDGTVTPPTDGGVVIPDTGFVPGDTGTPAGKTCPEILTCIQGCAASDQTCFNGCVASGTTDAQKKIGDLGTCTQNATKGSCKDKCASTSDPACATCVQAACKTERTACLGGGGPVEAGFGDVCEQSAPCTGTGMFCVTFQGKTKGYCTKECKSGALCSGAPTDTYSPCNVKVQSTGGATKDACGFICKTKTETHKCPSTMVCSTKEDQPGSGQFSCEPPA